MMFISRSFNHVAYNSEHHSVIKTSHETEKLINEINWYRECPNSLQEYLPLLIRYSTRRYTTFLEYQYCPYEPLSKQFLERRYSYERWMSITSQLLDVLQQFTTYMGSHPEALRKKCLYNMLVDKTCDRLGKLRKTDFFYPLFVNNFKVNGVVCGPLDRYVPLLSSAFCRLFDRNSLEFSVIHGDFCFSNILFDPSENRLKLIDPRGEFGLAGIYGDIRYDLAKLRHSVNGLYDFIIADRFTLETERADFRYQFENPPTTVSSGFDDQLCDRGYNLIEIKFIEAVLFLSMVPLHSEKINRQIVMLCQGAYKLEEILQALKIGKRYR